VTVGEYPNFYVNLNDGLRWRDAQIAALREAMAEVEHVRQDAMRAYFNGDIGDCFDCWQKVEAIILPALAVPASPTAAPLAAAERDAQIAALEAVQDEAEAELVRFTDALMNIKRRIADAFAGDNLHSEARALVGYIKDVLALGADSQAALRAARGEASDADYRVERPASPQAAGEEGE
jgi:hypothetical protein